ncbi:Protein of unknown function [Ferrimonas sediminum]|uniref:DUF3157 domain-containing protein n=1 Tax=Ferrimonas sediminum TaxID=718193 RepID=A0A1G8Q9F9_9GAMM|nr:DUF3157 family protein [Ferrimonas sediminum]SDJ01238.1 Protein of unknown function [Ferrimonas sediminum]
MRSKLALAALALLMATSAQAADQILTLEDGRQVILRDDFTWQYLAPANEPEETVRETSTTPDAIPPVAATIPVIATAPTAPSKGMPAKPMSSGVKVVPGQDKDVMQLSDSGADILLGHASYEGGELVIFTAITNQGRESIIEIDLSVRVMDENGQILADETVPVWRSIKRMADTYLRPDSSKPGLVIRIPVEQREVYQLKVEVEALSTR